MTLIPYKNLTIHAAPDFDAGIALNSNFVTLANFCEWTTDQFAGLDFYTTGQVDTLLAGKAAVGHNHDGTYAPVGHTHSEYASADHDHDADYAPIDHDHDGTYAPVGHTHSEYAAADHNHDAAYAPIDHDHSGVYSPVDHTHTAAEIGAVASLNGLSGPVDLAEGPNIALTVNGSTITIAATGGGEGGATMLAGLQDVSISAVTAGELLAHDGTEWINRTLAEAGISAADHDHDAVYAQIDHDHDAVYAPLDHDHAGVYAPVDHTHSAADVGSYTTGQVDTLLAGKAASDHNHDGVYAPVGHTHSEYAAADHNHDDSYAPVDHTHSEYAFAEHSHSAADVGAYSTGQVDTLLADKAASDHNHDGIYAEVGHTHSEYAATNHDHDAAYAPIDHDHDGDYAAVDHTHTAADVGAYSTSQVDTLLTGKAAANHNHDGIYAEVGHTHTPEEVGTLSAGQITTGILGRAPLIHHHDGVYAPIDHTHTASAVGAYAREEVRGLLAGVDNALINGGFRFFQRHNPNTLTTIADGAYGPDRWVVLSQDATQCQRITINDGHAARLKRTGAGTGKFGLLQAIEHQNTLPLRGREVCFQARVRCSAMPQISMAILAWTGTADAPAKDVVLDWTSPTMPSFFHGAPLTICGTSATGTTTDQWVDVSVTGAVPANCNNLLCFVWTNNAVSNAVTLDVSKCGLHLGSEPRLWVPRSYGQELALCQRYFEKSFTIDQVPANNASQTGLTATVVPMNSNWNSLYPVTFKAPKRTTPSVTFYNPSASTPGTARSLINGNDIPIVIYFTHHNGTGVIVNDTAVTAGDQLAYQWAAQSEI